VLTLTIKGNWYDKIASGEKKEEYREIKPYYDSRLLKLFETTRENLKLPFPEPDNIRQIVFKNGYSADSRKFVADCKLSIGTGREEWGADPDTEYYILHIINVEEL
jgi:hypothetical protein